MKLNNLKFNFDVNFLHEVHFCTMFEQGTSICHIYERKYKWFTI
jgi:hypothetical protein